MRLSSIRVPLSSRNTRLESVGLSRMPPRRARCAVVDSPKKKSRSEHPFSDIAVMLGVVSLPMAWEVGTNAARIAATVKSKQNRRKRGFIERHPFCGSIFLQNFAEAFLEDMYDPKEKPV